MFCSANAWPVEIDTVQASRSGQRYMVELSMIVNIPESYVRTILEDPDRVVRVNNELVGVEHLPSSEPGVRRFRDHTRACVWLFCVDYHNTLAMRVLANGEILLEVEPGRSEFEYGRFVWQTGELGPDRTRLSFSSETIPGFWVPSLGMLQSRMRRGLRRMAINMECEYRQDDSCVEAQWVDSTIQ